MKYFILAIAVLVALGGGALCVVAEKNAPFDVRNGAQEKANLAMIRAYGPDWREIYTKSVKDHIRSKAMSATYRSALK